MSEVSKKAPGIGQLVLVLFVISAITAFALGLVNYITADKIEAMANQKTEAAMNEVLAADSYEQQNYTGGDETVLGVFKAGDAGYVVQVEPSGFSGGISMVVGVAADGTISGVSITHQTETSGLGTNACKPAFRDQYVGGAGPFDVDKDGGTIVALTGATITSRAVTRGVNAAMAAVQNLG